MRNAKRALSLVLVLALALGMCVIGAGAAVFSDVPATYAYSAEVQFLSEIEVITGYPDGTFKPENTITRAEAAAVIFRALAGKESAAENYQGQTIFPDVPSGHWACGYVNFCTEMGIVNGYPDGTFKPDQTITYAEYVTMLARALGLDIGKDLNFPFGYIAEATVEGINYGVDLAASEPCPRGAVAKLTYNAIFDATYRRIANNIYTTEKPTIAKNVLQLEDFDGVVTSINKYDWLGAKAAGEGKFRITDDNNAMTFDYDLENAYLGKEVKVWYKPNTVSASGDKVYAVVEKKNTTLTLPHIVMRSDMKDYADDVAKNQITYSLNDVNYKAKFEDDVVFVENNEFIGQNDKTADPAVNNIEAFFGIRDWIPATYTFIDNDNNGKYDFAVRNLYSFGKISSINNSRLYLDGIPAIDRNDDGGKAYEWNAGIEDLGVDDWVIYYADGAVTSLAEGKTRADTYASLVGGPSFKTDLYGETNYATFEPMDAEALALDEKSGDDEFVFGGTTYRTWSKNAVRRNVADLIDSDVAAGDEFDLFFTKKFGGIIASAEAVDKSSGNFILFTATGIEPARPDKSNFTIYAYNSEGVDTEYTVKFNKTKGLNVYNNDGTKDKDRSGKLNYTTLSALVAAAGTPYVLFEYKDNSAGQITELNYYANNNGAINTTGEYKNYYNTKTNVLTGGILGTYDIAENALTFVVTTTDDGETVKTFKGTFPKLKKNAAAEIVGAKVKVGDNDANTTKALAVVTNGNVSTSDNENNVGYLRRITDRGTHYEYTIAYGNNASAVLKSPEAETAADSAADNDCIDGFYTYGYSGAKKATLIMFDINEDGTISNMRYLEDDDTIKNTAEDNDEKQFLSAFVVKGYNTKGTITLIPIDAKAALQNVTGRTDAADVDAVLNPTGAPVTLNVAEDANVFLFTLGSTNDASVSMGGLGDLVKFVEGSEAMVVTVAYNGETEEVISIFADSETVTAAAS